MTLPSKRNVCLVALVSFVVVLVQARTVRAEIDFNQPLDAALLENKSLAELWLMRNEIYARRGRPFKTYELHVHFMSKPWYRPNLDYSDRLLTRTERANADLILQREQALRRNRYVEVRGVKTVNVDNVANRFQYGSFSDEELEKLARNGFLVLPTTRTQLFHIYENNDYAGIPSFITTDLVLQLYHIFFNMTLRYLEQEHLSRTLDSLLTNLSKHAELAARNATTTSVKDAAKANHAYLAVPRLLFGSRPSVPSGELGRRVESEKELCAAHGGWADSPLLRRKLDYSQFVARGHYTRNETLTRYFLAMMWIGLTGLDLRDERQVLQAVLITHHLYHARVGNRRLVDLWHDLYEPTAFYVGVSDDVGPRELKATMDEVYGRSAPVEEYAAAEKLRRLQTLVLQLAKDKVRITGHGDWGAQPPQFRLMGQRFIPDSHVFDRLTIVDRKKNHFRYFPNGLDVMAAFGSPLAKDLMLTELKDTWKDWPDYPTKLNEVIEEYASLPREEWTQNLYYHWLWCLKALVQHEPKPGLPFFMTTRGWKLKSLSTALASWSELRHDTILYSKQSVAAECGGESHEVRVWIPEPPKGYVEPNLAFYKRLLALLNGTKTGLVARKTIDRRMQSLFDRFIELTEFLEEAAELQLAGKKLSLAQYRQIQKLGSLVENLTWTVLFFPESRPESPALISGPDKHMPVIADVHTGNFRALEVGVGEAHEVYVAVEIEGRLKLTRGAVFSYYEFDWPASDRLTDEKWQAMLKEGRAPPLPSWTLPFRSTEPKPRPRYLYKPENPAIPDWSTEPGWKTIYYETGC